MKELLSAETVRSFLTGVGLIGRMRKASRVHIYRCMLSVSMCSPWEVASSEIGIDVRFRKGSRCRRM